MHVGVRVGLSSGLSKKTATRQQVTKVDLAVRAPSSACTLCPYFRGNFFSAKNGSRKARERDLARRFDENDVGNAGSSARD